MRIIPAIDIIGGKCVRLTKGDYSTKKIYNENPLEVAKQFESYGIKHLHLVDLDAAKAKKIINHKTLYEISSKTSLSIDFGGGIKSDNDLKIAFENGAKQITSGSVAATDKPLFLKWLKNYGSDKIILGSDCKNRKITTHGWQKSTEIDVVDFIDEYLKLGLKYTITTDVAKDGMLAGTNIELYKEILGRVEINLIASGGITSISELLELKKVGCEGAIIGKAIYENKISLKELSKLC